MERNKIGLQILKEIHKLNLNYCIARNFETFPIIGNDLDIFFDCDINFLTKIIKNICKQYDWVYFHNKKFSQWPQHNTVKTYSYFLFSKKKGLYENLQIDFFCGVSYFGQPILTAKKIIEKYSFFDSKIGFNRTNNKLLGILTAFQIEGLGRRKINMVKNQKKIKRYMDIFARNFNCISKNDENIFDDIFYLKLKDLKTLYKCSIKKDLYTFCRKISKLKIKLLIKILKKNPFSFFLLFLRRIIFLFKIYTFNAPGLIIYLDKVYIDLFDEINFQRIKILPNYINTFSPQNRKFLERSGVIIISKNKLKKDNLNNDMIIKEKTYLYKILLETYEKSFN